MVIYLDGELKIFLKFFVSWMTEDMVKSNSIFKQCSSIFYVSFTVFCRSIMFHALCYVLQWKSQTLFKTLFDTNVFWLDNPLLFQCSCLYPSQSFVLICSTVLDINQYRVAVFMCDLGVMLDFWTCDFGILPYLFSYGNMAGRQIAGSASHRSCQQARSHKCTVAWRGVVGTEPSTTDSSS